MNPFSFGRASVLALLPLVAVGCNFKKDKIVGSCEKVEEGSYAGNSRRCTDAYAKSHLKSCTGKNEKTADHVLLFRMDNGKHLGSVPFVVENDDDSATLPRIMSEHLLAKFPSALHSKLKAAAPGVTNNKLRARQEVSSVTASACLFAHVQPEARGAPSGLS